MTILYEVKTGHTEKVLKAFVKLNDKTRGDRMKIMMRYVILAGLFFMTPKALTVARGGYVVCWIMGILIVILAIFRNWFTYVDLLQKDKYYKERIEITMSFGLPAFEVKGEEKNTYKYHLIEALYEDSELFYLRMEDSDLFIIPKDSFTRGNPEEFREFIQNATEKKFEEVHLHL